MPLPVSLPGLSQPGRARSNVHGWYPSGWPYCSQLRRAVGSLSAYRKRERIARTKQRTPEPKPKNDRSDISMLKRLKKQTAPNKKERTKEQDKIKKKNDIFYNRTYTPGESISTSNAKCKKRAVLVQDQTQGLLAAETQLLVGRDARMLVFSYELLLLYHTWSQH